MAPCFSGFSKLLGIDGEHRRQSAICGDASAWSADSLPSCSTRASTLEATQRRRKRDKMWQIIFGGAAAESSVASAPRMRKRDWLRKMFGLGSKADMREQEVLLEGEN
eukprot:TRINITY_DN8096_c0_g1_i1.p2 TRINITY_DN8096_c0_g1~~TRINITY_DN8096_c0_g1_i1.p2  ORF type:complete len:125 (-),score=18.55 TRINITY_DN8096_c0_g1_i1:524-847(-)